MNDVEFEKATVSWLASRGYLIQKLEPGEIPGTFEVPLPLERPLSAPESRFNEFWAMYPRKVGKEAAKKIFEKNDLATQQDIIDGLNIHIEANAFSNEKCYIKHPSTWLTQKVWKDEPEKRAFPKPQIGNRNRDALDAFLQED